jgi:hypothetical protein
MAQQDLMTPDKFGATSTNQPPTTPIPLLSEQGITGLWQFSGYLDEEKLLQLRGWRGVRVYRQMMDNDATIGAINFAFEMLLRHTDWRVEPASDSPEDLGYAEFVEGCRQDMSLSWESHIAEVLTMLGFGWSCAEIVYKKRLGPDQTDSKFKSKYNDGCIGWRKLAPRAQETLQHWEFDEDGGVCGWWQQPPQGGGLIYLPIEKILLFRTTDRKNNPEGRSLYRNCYTAWYRKKEMERIESIGAERDLAGMPICYVPREWMDTTADSNTKAMLTEIKKIVRNVRNDEQMGLVFPSIYDPETKAQLLKFDLISTASRKQVDTNAIIGRYVQDILTSVLANVLTLGQNAVGSYALASSKTNMLAVAMGALMDSICSVHNRFSIPRLFEVNNFKPKNGPPKLVHGDLEKQDMQILCAALLQVVQAGGVTLGGEDDEIFIRQVLGMPEKVGIEQKQTVQPPSQGLPPDGSVKPVKEDNNDGGPQPPTQPTSTDNPNNPFPGEPNESAGIGPMIKLYQWLFRKKA